ncbi:hypothetical protein VP01_3324g1 [Puccinia sorghi]|uniref:Uncharacterized protein n=1 Tax=Puccinia sorghi TaxID=27349 RepID=A0A0L6UX90_9BASI|nr:hypothetical protein VP01_3324g1 [Puccinia sorghi]
MCGLVLRLIQCKNASFLFHLILGNRVSQWVHVFNPPDVTPLYPFVNTLDPVENTSDHFANTSYPVAKSFYHVKAICLPHIILKSDPVKLTLIYHNYPPKLLNPITSVKSCEIIPDHVLYDIQWKLVVKIVFQGVAKGGGGVLVSTPLYIPQLAIYILNLDHYRKSNLHWLSVACQDRCLVGKHDQVLMFVFLLIDMQHALAKLTSKLHLFAYVNVLEQKVGVTTEASWEFLHVNCRQLSKFCLQSQTKSRSKLLEKHQCAVAANKRVPPEREELQPEIPQCWLLATDIQTLYVKAKNKGNMYTLPSLWRMCSIFHHHGQCNQIISIFVDQYFFSLSQPSSTTRLNPVIRFNSIFDHRSTLFEFAIDSRIQHCCQLSNPVLLFTITLSHFPLFLVCFFSLCPLLFLSPHPDTSHFPSISGMIFFLFCLCCSWLFLIFFVFSLVLFHSQYLNSHCQQLTPMEQRAHSEEKTCLNLNSNNTLQSSAHSLINSDLTTCFLFLFLSLYSSYHLSYCLLTSFLIFFYPQSYCLPVPVKSIPVAFLNISFFFSSLSSCNKSQINPFFYTFPQDLFRLHVSKNYIVSGPIPWKCFFSTKSVETNINHGFPFLYPRLTRMHTELKKVFWQCTKGTKHLQEDMCCVAGGAGGNHVQLPVLEKRMHVNIRDKNFNFSIFHFMDYGFKFHFKFLCAMVTRHATRKFVIIKGFVSLDICFPQEIYFVTLSKITLSKFITSQDFIKLSQKLAHTFARKYLHPVPAPVSLKIPAQTHLIHYNARKKQPGTRGVFDPCMLILPLALATNVPRKHPWRKLDKYGPQCQHPGQRIQNFKFYFILF